MTRVVFITCRCR